MKIKMVYTMTLFCFLSIPSLYAQKKVVVVESGTIQPVAEQSKRIKRKVAIGRFSNETQYGKGLFYDKKNDPMGKQAMDILSTKLASSQKFILLERNDMDALMKEVQQNKSVIKADYLILGSITEFGRKTTGHAKVFSSSKTQTVEAGVSIRIVDVHTGLIIYSDEAKGEAKMTNKKSILGYGGEAGFDATLSDKAISAAISQLVENVINKCTNKPWRSYFLNYEDGAILIAGGHTQGLMQGDTFIVMKKGKTIKNPQTGLNIELPGKKMGMITIQSTAGDTPESEYSFVTYSGDSLDQSHLANYYILEDKK